jgi:hypothetical protein
MTALTAKEKDDQLKEVARLEAEEKASTGRVDRYVESVKQNLLFQPSFNWGDLLSAAPTAICNLGAIFVLSTTDDAYHITIHPPKDGFKHFAYVKHPPLPMMRTKLLMQVHTETIQV